MKYVGILIGVLVWTNVAAQKTFDTEYSRIMATVKQWESAPDSIINVQYSNSRNGRRVTMKSTFISKRKLPNGMTRDVTYSKKYKVKHSRKGVSEVTKVYILGGRVGLIRKVNGNYMIARAFGDVVLMDRTIVININSKRPMYFR
jgi:hypothetical protein